MKWVLSFAIICLVTCTALPCVNRQTTETKYDGSSASTGGRPTAARLRDFMEFSFVDDGEEMETRLRNNPGFAERNDYAVALMYLGRGNEAVALLQQLEAEKPGDYSTAANLGTALELTGQNSKALYWIQECIKRNPDAHAGTEWLHVKILQAKIAQEKNPDFFKEHSVLGLHPSQISTNVVIDGRSMSIKQLIGALDYQLNERMRFVKPPDAPVASLLFDYAAIEAAENTLESAKQVLALAMEYGYPRDHVAPLLALYDHRIAWAKTKRYITYSAIGVAALAFIIYACKKRWIVYRR